jgi:hypothetical protein
MVSLSSIINDYKRISHGRVGTHESRPDTAGEKSPLRPPFIKGGSGGFESYFVSNEKQEVMEDPDDDGKEGCESWLRIVIEPFCGGFQKYFFSAAQIPGLAPGCQITYGI